MYCAWIAHSREYVGKKGMTGMYLYHGSTVVVDHPEIRNERFNKDFYFGFYCTLLREQAERWATRFGDGIVNVYVYTPDLS